MTKVPDSDAESALCLQCGLCCDGTLFDRGKLEDGEMPPLPGTQIHVEDNEDANSGERHFTMPCSMLEGIQCSIYQHRPRACRKFACKQLQGLRAGTISLSESLHRIDTARTALADVAAQLDVAAIPPVPRRRAIAAHLNAMREIGQLPLKAAVKAVALEKYLDRHFRPDGNAQSVKDACTASSDGS